MFDLHTLIEELLVLSFKTHSKALKFPLVLPVQIFCSWAGCCLHSCAVLRGHGNSEKNRPVCFRSSTSESDVCLALVKGWIRGFLLVVNIIDLCEKCTFPTRSLFCITVGCCICGMLQGMCSNMNNSATCKQKRSFCLQVVPPPTKWSSSNSVPT